MSQAPVVSIVVPSFRQGRFLGAALESLRRQHYPHLEVRVHDNCSQDETPAVLERHRCWIDAIVVQKDGGQADALRRGFEQSSGEVLGWLNADDLLMPDAIRRAVDRLAAPDHPDLVYGHAAFLDERGNFRRYFHEIQPPTPGLLRDHSDYIAQPSAFFRRSTYESVGGIDARLRYTMDWELWCRMERAGARFAFVDETLAGVRIHEAAKTVSGGLRRLAEILRVNRRHGSRRLPLVALRHLYGDHLRQRFRGLQWPARAVGRRLAPRPEEGRGIVLGLAPEGRVVQQSFAIRFPVLDRVARVSLHLEAPEVCDLEVTLEGRPGRIARVGQQAWVFSWYCEPAIDIDALTVKGRVSAELARAGTIRVLAVNLDREGDSDSLVEDRRRESPPVSAGSPRC